MLDQTTERLFYGDDPSFENAGLRNARGRLVEHYDQAGRMAMRQYTPDGTPLRAERQLMQLGDATRYDAEPDWTSAEPSWSALYSEPSDLDPTTYRTLSALDALGRVREQLLPDQTSRSFTYLQSGGVTRVGVTTSDGYYVDKAFLEGAIYNARGQRTLAQLGNGAETTYEYDRETFRLKWLKTTRVETDTNGNPVTTRHYQNIEYTYDPAGNITRQMDHAQQKVESNETTQDVLQGLNVSPVCDYIYDAFYQLTLATGRVHQLLEQNDRHFGIKGTQHLSLDNTAAVERYQRKYEYDLGGNIEAIHHYRLSTDGDTSWNWTQPIWVSETSNRSLPANDLNGNPISNPESRFDANGNCIFMPHLRAMTWNYRNNLARAVFVLRDDVHSNDAEYYVYSADGMRIRKLWRRVVRMGDDDLCEQDQIQVTEKVYFDGCEIKRVYCNDTLLLDRLTSHITDGTNRIALLHRWTADNASWETDNINQPKTHYQFSNHLGSVSLELDSDEEHVISYEEYFPFGGTAFIAGRETNVRLKEYRYSGKERDDSTGFYYYGYRYYAPWIGNWLSPDPIGPEDSLNLYQFVSNNPVVFSDPLGLHGNGGSLRERVWGILEDLLNIPPEPLTIVSVDPESVAESTTDTPPSNLENNQPPSVERSQIDQDERPQGPAMQSIWTPQHERERIQEQMQRTSLLLPELRESIKDKLEFVPPADSQNYPDESSALSKTEPLTITGEEQLLTISPTQEEQDLLSRLPDQLFPEWHRAAEGEDARNIRVRRKNDREGITARG